MNTTLKSTLSFLLIIAIAPLLKGQNNNDKFYNKEIIVEFITSLDDLNNPEKSKEMTFQLFPLFNQEELQEWISIGKKSDFVAQFEVLSGNETEGWTLKLILHDPLSKQSAKILLAADLRIKFFMLEGEKIPYNVFISKKLQ